MKDEISIEFGSSNLRIYKKNIGLIFSEPNVLIYQTTNKKVSFTSFGRNAKEKDGKLLENETLFYPVKNGILCDVLAQKRILSYALEKIYPDNYNPSQLKIIATISCGIKKDQLDLYKNVFRDCSIKDYSILFQPICIAQITNISEQQPQMIVDFGAGKTEIAIVINNQILKGVSIELGGNIMNLGIKEILKSDKNILTSNNILEKIKLSIGSLFKTDSSVYKIWAQDINTLNSNTYAIISKDINIVYIDCHDKIISVIQAMLADCSPEIIASINDYGIILCGDGSKIIGCKKYYESKLKIKCRVLNTFGVSCVEGASCLFKQLQKKVMLSL